MPSSIDPNAALYPRVRYALTGSQTTGPEDADLTLLVQDTVADLLAANSRIGVDGMGNVNLAGGDLLAWQAFVGYEAGARYIESPAGQRMEMMLRQIKIGRMTKTYEAFGPEAVAKHLRELAAQARLRIACIRNGVIARNQAQAASGGTVSLAGRRRAHGQPVTIQSLALAGTPGEGQGEL